MRVYASAEMTLTDTNDGVSVTGIDRYYMASSSSSGITIDSQGWKPDPQETNPISRYHWSYEVVNYSDGAKIPSKPAVIGVYGKEGKDAVTVSLSSEAHTFAGTESQAIASSVTIDISAFKGNQRIPTSIGTITGGISGQLTHSELGRGTTNNKLVINATSSLSKGNGTLSIPIVADGRTFNKVFSWSVAFKGKTGDKGDAGPQGPQGPRGLTGLQGPEGKQGIKGDDGRDSYTHIAYASGDQGQSFNHDTFSQATHIGMYVSDKQNSSDNWSDYEWTLIKGSRGSQGIQGPEGIGGITPYFHTAYANSANGTVGFSVDNSSDKEYIGQYTSYARTGKGRNLIRNSDFSDGLYVSGDDRWQFRGTEGGLSSDNNLLIKSETGASSRMDSLFWLSNRDEFSTGDNLAITFRLKADSSNSILVRLGSSGWSSGVHKLNVETEMKDYSVSFPITSSSDDTRAVVFWLENAGEIEIERVKLEKGSEATPYGISPEDAMQDSTNPEDYSWTKIKGDKGDKGDRGPQGIQGPSGSNGQSQWVHIRYSANPTGSGMTPSPSSTTKYVGIAVTNSATAPPFPEFTWSKYVGEDGARGPQGIQGPKGEDGLDTYTWVRYADEKDGTGIDNFPDGKKFIGLAYNKTTPNESNNPNDYQWSAMYDEEAFKGVGLADKTEVLSGTEIYTDKADDSNVHVEIDGKSYQHVGSGKNLFNGKIYKGFIDMGDGKTDTPIPLNPTWPDSVYSDRISVKPSTRYTLSGFTDADMRVREFDSNGVYTGSNSGRGFTTLSTTSFVRILWHKGLTLEEQAGNIQLEEGSTATAYEPLPAPTPYSPIEIHSLNDVDVVSSGQARNLYSHANRNVQNLGGGVLSFDREETTYGFYLVGASDDSDDVRMFDVINGNGTYTISFDFRGSQNGSGLIGVAINEKTSSNITSLSDNTYKRFVQTVSVDNFKGDGTDYISWNQSWTYGWIRNIMVVKNSDDADFMPAPEDMTENDNHPLIDKINPLLDEPLRSIGDVKDRLYRDSDGLWKIERNIGGVIFDGSESWTMTSSASYGDGRRFYTSVPDSSSVQRRQRMISSHFGQQSGEFADKAFQHGSRAYLYPRSSIATTESEFKSWLASNNVAFQYLLDKTTIEILSQSLQDKLNNLRSFEDSNYVYTVINDKTDTVSENLKPTLHATFKGGGWYSRWKTEKKLDNHQDQLDKTVDTEQLNTAVADLDADKLSIESYEQFLASYDGERNSIERSIESVAEDIGKALARTETIETTLGDGAQDWIFTNTKIRMSDEGITLGEEASGTYLQISSDKISFFAGTTDEVAYVSGGMLYINKAVFVQSIQVSEYLLSKELDGHLTFRFVGEG